MKNKLIGKISIYSFSLGIIFGISGWSMAKFAICHFSLHHQLSSDQGKALYTLGQYYAKRAEFIRLTDSEAKIVTKGFQDAVEQKKPLIDFESNQFRLENLTESRRIAQAEEAKKAGHEFLKEFVKSKGTLSVSGLAYRIALPGSEKKPTLKDWVEVTYHGTLINGKVIDSTENEKVKLPMSGVIRGWSEGLQLIGEGGEIELVVPSDLAYGDSGTHSQVPPGATLVFKIYLHRIIESGRAQ